MKYRIDSFNLLSDSFQSDPFTQKNIGPGVIEQKTEEVKEKKAKFVAGADQEKANKDSLRRKEPTVESERERHKQRRGKNKLGRHSFLLPRMQGSLEGFCVSSTKEDSVIYSFALVFPFFCFVVDAFAEVVSC
ncbi:hypothetical protein CDAR_497711 [Caerostris darwini]|uniref:Uncharacterized protein n=1 Tax=Caerostris darwini TaxID=1538125 RepID=A0AAV4PTK5_9ARAC|nr:hypothetical protein CDAR_497711 [Caerostris darwini]